MCLLTGGVGRNLPATLDRLPVSNVLQRTDWGHSLRHFFDPSQTVEHPGFCQRVRGRVPQRMSLRADHMLAAAPLEREESRREKAFRFRQFVEHW